MKILVILQNAWSKEWAGKNWPRHLWLQALEQSRSGKRLQVMKNHLKSYDIHFDNTTPHVGDHPDSILPADHNHIRSVIEEVNPSIIVTCGSQAFQAIIDLNQDKPVLAIPHPSYRVVTNDLFIAAAHAINKGVTGVIKLRQLKGMIKKEIVKRLMTVR